MSLKGSSMQPQVSTEYAPMFILIVLAFSILVALIVTAITILVHCKIFAKAAFSWALGLLMMVPIANIIMLFYLAFADWPIWKELRQLRQRCGQTPA